MNKPHTTPNNNFRCLSQQPTVIFRHYFTLVVLHEQLFPKRDFRLPPWSRGYYAASSANLLLMFQDNLSVPSLAVKNPKVKMGPIHCPETFGKKLPLRAAEERSSQLLLKSQLTPHKKNTLSGSKQSLKPQSVTQRKDILSQVYRNPDMTSPVTIATCLISSYLIYVPSLNLISSP
jgi:hypothetical protein